MITILIFLLVLSVLVLVHELGHFVSAKIFKIRVDEFGLGFPPRGIGWYKNAFGKWLKVRGTKSFEELSESEAENLRPKKGTTIYSLNWLPLGGFVKIKGENGDDSQDGDSFASKKIWKRAIVLVAGVVMNIVLAWFLFSIGYMLGMPQTTEDLGPGAIVSNQAVSVSGVMADSPAEKAGIKAGDQIISAAGIKINTDTTLQEIIADKGGEEVEVILINTNNEEILVKIVPEVSGDRTIIGVNIYSSAKVRYPFFNALIEGVKTTGWILKEIVVSFVNLFKDLFSGVSVGDQFAGPIGIANITGQAAKLGFVYLLQFMALLSLNLAIINVLPFPALDGGRLLFLLIEKLKGKPVKKEIENMLNNIGFILLMILILFITVKDVIKLF